MYNRVKRVTGKDAKFLGVLGGISKYLDPTWDPILVRISFIILSIFSGFLFMGVLYFITAALLQKEDELN